MVSNGVDAYGSLNRHTFISKDNTHEYMSRPLVASHMVYRDLSSNNILLTKVYVTKITDLEVAEVSFHSQGKPLTQAPDTQVFMPPYVNQNIVHHCEYLFTEMYLPTFS